MSSRRLVYQDWIVDMGYDPQGKSESQPAIPAERLFESIDILAQRLVGDDLSERVDCRRERIIEAVREALTRLTEEEREFVVLYYLMGRSCREIADSSGRATHKIEALHSRTIRHLRSLLANFVSEEFGLKLDHCVTCPICNSQFRAEIDLLLKGKEETETWRETIRLIKDNYQIQIKTPQTILGHIRYHN